MREIKFRAWMHWENKMVFSAENPEMFAFASNGLNLKTDNDQLYHPRVSFMQFTGLKDKNGKEIFEGDRIIHEQFPQPLVVKWDWDQWGLFDGICNEASIGNNDCEVIGNIYEN